MQVLLLFLLTSIQVIQTIEPITTSIVVGGALSAGAVYQFWDDKIKVKCHPHLGARLANDGFIWLVVDLD